jgi:peptide/nickel transport system substrate-binding protein
MARIADFIPLIHPVQVGTGNQELMDTLLFSSLVHVAKDENTIIPDLATSWEVSADATTYTFHLDPRAVFSDGQPENAADVAYTINWAAQNADEYKEDAITQFVPEIKGSAGVLHTTNPVPGLATPDNETVVITLEHPDGIYLRELANAPYFILPQHLLKDLKGSEAETCAFCVGTPGQTIGSGPYDIITPLTKDGATFQAKKNWWKGTDPNIQQIVYKIQDSDVSVTQLEAGELDFVIRVPPDAGPRLAKVPGLKELNVPGVGIFAMDFNNKTINNKLIRQAIAYAINRPQIIQQVLGGLATLNYTIPPGFTVYEDINKYDFDVAKAKSLLQQANWDPNRTFTLLSLSDDPNFTVVAPVIQQALQQIGMKVNLVAEPDAQFIKDEFDPTKFDALFSFGGSEGVNWSQSRPYTDCSGKSTLGNTLFFLDATQCALYTPLYDQAIALPAGPAQDAVLHKLALALNDNLPEIYLWQPNYLHVYTDRLGGGFAVYPNERESFANIQDWTLAP